MLAFALCLVILHGTPAAHRSARLKDSAEQLTAALESADRLAAAEAEQADDGALTRTETTSLVSQLSQAAAQLETTALAGRLKSFSCAATRVPCPPLLSRSIAPLSVAVGGLSERVPGNRTGTDPEAMWKRVQAQGFEQMKQPASPLAHARTVA